MSVDQLFYAWEEWCREQGRDYVSNKQMFGPDLRAAVPGLQRSQPQDADGRSGRRRQYEGVGLKSEVSGAMPAPEDIGPAPPGESLWDNNLFRRWNPGLARLR